MKPVPRSVAPPDAADSLRVAENRASTSDGLLPAAPAVSLPGSRQTGYCTARSVRSGVIRGGDGEISRRSTSFRCTNRRQTTILPFSAFSCRIIVDDDTDPGVLSGNADTQRLPGGQPDMPGNGLRSGRFRARGHFRKSPKKRHKLCVCVCVCTCVVRFPTGSFLVF